MAGDEIQKIADELAIRRLLDEYCLRLEVNRFEDWLDLFTDDTVYDVFGRSLTGREELAAMLSQAPHGVHLPGAARIDLDGDRAETVQNYLFIPNSDDRWNAGWYARTLVRTSAGWRIARTCVKIARIGELASNAKAHELPFPVVIG
jgi:SnoaL-like domain